MADSSLPTTWTVYVLKNPRTNAVRYVGFTSQKLSRRLLDHVSDATRSGNHCRTHKDNWLLSLLSIGLCPVIEVLEAGSGDGWKEAERRWIAHYRSMGARLVNGTDGGDGVIGYWTPEMRRDHAKKREAAMTPEQRSERSKKAASRHTPEERSEIARKRQAALTPEQRDQIAKKAAARMTPEQRKKLMEGYRSLSPEQRSTIAKKAATSKPPEQRSEIARKRAAIRLQQDLLLLGSAQIPD